VSWSSVLVLGLDLMPLDFNLHSRLSNVSAMIEWQIDRIRHLPVDSWGKAFSGRRKRKEN